MEFLLLFLDREGAPSGDPAGMAEMGRLAQELARQKKLRRGAPLAEAQHRKHVRVRGKKPFVSDGPFAESKEVVAGFWVVDVADRAEAIAIAARAPHARDGIVDVHPIEIRYLFADSGKGTPYLLAFNVEAGFTDPGNAKRGEMIVFGEALARAGTLIETAPLAADPPVARVEGRGGKPLVTDGPFAEVKEMIGGYGVVRVADQAAAIALATEYPHARWGSIEVREILFFDRI